LPQGAVIRFLEKSKIRTVNNGVQSIQEDVTVSFKANETLEFLESANIRFVEPTIISYTKQ